MFYPSKVLSGHGGLRSNCRKVLDGFTLVAKLYPTHKRLGGEINVCKALLVR